MPEVGLSCMESENVTRYFDCDNDTSFAAACHRTGTYCYDNGALCRGNYESRECVKSAFLQAPSLVSFASEY